MSPSYQSTTFQSAEGASALVVLAGSFALFAWYYLHLRTAFFDDVFIALHIARNGADHGSWQYFQLMSRPALLASSPLKILLLTIAAKITTIFGFTGRTFTNAKLILVVYAPLVWAMWYPFWKGRRVPFLWLGTLYFACALGLDAAVDFEGGLLFCWVATLVFVLGNPESRVRELGWLVPLGFLIRPDVAIPVFVGTAVILRHGLLIPFAIATLKRGAALLISWCALCWIMKVWPIPVTYWAKASLPMLVEEKYMIEVFIERLGWMLGSRFLHSASAATLLGASCLLSLLLVTVWDGRARLAAFLAVTTAGALLLHTPSGFWWYYENDLMVFIGVAVGLLCRYRLPDILFDAKIRPVGAFLVMTMMTLMAGKAFIDGPIQWRIDGPSRAQGYQYLGSKALGDGRYTLPGIGTVLIKNPELGMISFFSGDRAWIWDSGGLAQPLFEKHVQTSALRYFFPMRLRESARTDAESIAARTGKSLRVVEVWGWEDRDFNAARKQCRYVIEDGAICVNEFLNQVEPVRSAPDANPSALQNWQLTMKDFGPHETHAGQAFNVQPDGVSAMWVNSENATSSTALAINEIVLQSSVQGDGTLVTAGVPKFVYAKAGEYSIYLLDRETGEKSNVMKFVVK